MRSYRSGTGGEGAGRGMHTSVYKTCNAAVNIVSGWEVYLDNSASSTTSKRTSPTLEHRLRSHITNLKALGIVESCSIAWQAGH